MYVPGPPHCTYYTTGCAYVPPLLSAVAYQRRRAACPWAPRTVHTPYAYTSLVRAVKYVRTAYRGTTGRELSLQLLLGALRLGASADASGSWVVAERRHRARR